MQQVSDMPEIQAQFPNSRTFFSILYCPAEDLEMG
jgi:hypothetical protein